MGYSNHADRMPDWPARMNADLTALYLGIGHNTLNEGVKAGRYPAPVREGGRIFWAKRQLDEFVSAQFNLTDGAHKNSWD
jgi:hypothetical protein